MYPRKVLLNRYIATQPYFKFQQSLHLFFILDKNFERNLFCLSFFVCSLDNVYFRKDKDDMTQFPVQVVAIMAETDKIWYRKLTQHLKPLRLAGIITLWGSSQILPASDIIQERNSHLDAASLLLLFLSPDFFTSTDCQEQLQRVWPRYLAHSLLVLPILVRPVDLSHSPLATIKALPANGRSIVEWRNMDEAFLDIVKGIHILISPQTAGATVRIIPTPPNEKG
jgi:hypothetical protein